MRPSSIRHEPVARRRVGPRTATAGIAVGVIVFAISCTQDKSPLAARRETGSVAELRDRPQPASVAATTYDESAQAAVPAPAPIALGKVAGERRDFAALQSAAAPAAPPAVTGMPSAAAVSQPATSGSMIVRTGYAGIEVDSLDTAIARVRALATRVNGFVANTTVQGGKEQLRSASLEVKVPAERFDDALAGLSPIGKVESVNVTAEDVGEEYVDIAARVENAHRLETRLVDLLANRTGKLQDVLSVERELARVREEIERYEGRMRFLRTRAAMSTLTIAVHEHVPVIVPVAGNGPILVAFRQAWRNFVGLVAGLIASLGILIPLGVLVFVGWIGVRRWVPIGGRHQAPPASTVEVPGD
jgi:hypothetical protein